MSASIMELCSNAVRGCIVAPQGRKLCIADLSNIEGRMLAWLASEEWKLQAFREYDVLQLAGGDWITGEDWRLLALAGHAPKLALDDKGEPIHRGPDLYKLAYAKAFKVGTGEVTKEQRQIGKVMELMLGYEGGVGAFLTGAATYGFDVEDLGIRAYETIPDSVLYEAGGFYDWTVKQKRPTFGLSRTAFVVCDSLKRMWRAAHPNVASFWKELDQACADAVSNPGETIQVRKLKVRRDGAWLRIGLPSGRALCYPQPKVQDGKVTYMGVNQYTRQWSRIASYGGKWAENVTQAGARDTLADPMPRIEGHGYAIVLSVHDELLTETPDEPRYSWEQLAALMATPPAWAPDLPLAAAGFETYRYRKD